MNCWKTDRPEVRPKRIYALRWLVLGFGTILVLVAGCAGSQQRVAQETFNQWRARAKISQGYSPSARVRMATPDKGREEKPASGHLMKQSPALPQMPVSLQMNDVDVSVLLRALARAADINIIINEKVKGKTDINIEKAPWDQVFKGVLRTNGLSYTMEGGIIRVMTLADMELDLKRRTEQENFRMTGEPVTRVVRVDYAEATKLKANLEKFLSTTKTGKAVGSVLVDQHTNSLIIRALPEDLNRILSLIDQLDRPTPQIRIEANIVEANQDTARSLGVQWGGVYGFQGSNGIQYNVGSGIITNTDTGTTPSSSNPMQINSSNFAINFPADLASNAMTIGFLMGGGSNLLALQLSALQTESKLTILSSPSITTLDNQQAIFESGREVPYQVEDANGAHHTEFKKAVLSLEVTPHVINNNMLKLKIKTTKDQVDTSSTSTTPPIITKKAETSVILYDGQTTVIGGLNESEDTNSNSGVPGLKDLPLIGHLFQGSAQSGTKNDVLIFITPHILKQMPGAGEPDSAPPSPATPDKTAP